MEAAAGAARDTYPNAAAWAQEVHKHLAKYLGKRGAEPHFLGAVLAAKQGGPAAMLAAHRVDGAPAAFAEALKKSMGLGEWVGLGRGVGER